MEKGHRLNVTKVMHLWNAVLGRNLGIHLTTLVRTRLCMNLQTEGIELKLRTVAIFQVFPGLASPAG